MKRFIIGTVVIGTVCVCMTIAGSFTPNLAIIQAAPLAKGSPADTPDNNNDVMAADHMLVAALAKADKAATTNMFDANFMWTNSAGDTLEDFSAGKVQDYLPKPPLGDESGAQISERTYGQIGAVQVARGKVHILRIWVKRPAGWRLLDYQEVTQRSGAAPPAGPTTNDCVNPCKGVPYTPKNDAERDILKSWGELETAVTNHDPQTWSLHFLDEFVLIASAGTDPVDKAGRLAALNKPGIGPAPPQLAADPQVRFFHFGDSVVMIAQTNPYSGKPAHISRVWVNRDGMWRMAFSYQTTIQSAAPIVPPKS